MTGITSHNSILMVIPTLGQRLDFLRLTLESLTRQGSHVVDVVVVCPAGALGARALAVEFGATVMDEPEDARGMSAAINAGFESALSHHRYLSWIGDDDLLEPGALIACVRAIEANDRSVLAFGQCRYIDDRGRQILVSRAGRLAPRILAWGPDLVPQPGLVFVREAVEAVGMLDTSLRYAMDLDLLLRLRQRGQFLFLNQVVASFRWHGSSSTVANRGASLAEAQRVQRRYVSRPLRPMLTSAGPLVRLATRLAARRVTKLAAKLRPTG